MTLAPTETSTPTAIEILTETPIATTTPPETHRLNLTEIPTASQTPTASLAPVASPTTESTETTPTALPTDTAVPAQTSPQAQSNLPSAGEAPAYSGGKSILVDISEQHLYAYEGDTLVYSFVASTGMNNATRVGNFAVQSKIPNAYGSTWNIWMPHWLGIYYAGSMENGIHALPILPNGATLWAGYLGTPISYGCVVLSSYEAGLLYDWAEIGTPVKIQW
jgi:lipoprotein-anchoring transpeptidase ErfK/SrfK